MSRSNSLAVRNPVLGLPGVRQLIDGMTPDARSALATLLAAIHKDAAQRATESWQRHKAPMACYWKAVSVYAGHLSRAVRRTREPQP